MIYLYGALALIIIAAITVLACGYFELREEFAQRARNHIRRLSGQMRRNSTDT